jgi:hypothetical protein
MRLILTLLVLVVGLAVSAPISAQTVCERTPAACE